MNIDKGEYILNYCVVEVHASDNDVVVDVTRALSPNHISTRLTIYLIEHLFLILTISQLWFKIHTKVCTLSVAH